MPDLDKALNAIKSSGAEVKKASIKVKIKLTPRKEKRKITRSGNRK